MTARRRAGLSAAPNRWEMTIEKALVNPSATEVRKKVAEVVAPTAASA